MFIIKSQDGMRRAVYSGAIDICDVEGGRYVVSVIVYNEFCRIAEFETYAEADTLVDELEKKLYEHIHHGDMWEKVDLCERSIEKAITATYEKMAVGHRDKDDVLVLPKELDDDWGVETVVGVEKDRDIRLTNEQMDELADRIIKRYDERTAAQVSIALLKKGKTQYS